MTGRVTPKKPKVFDLDAVANEANAEPFKFTFGGQRYEMPGTVDIRVVTSLTAGDLEAALRLLLGDEQWAKIQASPAVLDHVKFQSLLAAYMEHTGMTLGG
jgi:hypothetical protein